MTEDWEMSAAGGELSSRNSAGAREGVQSFIERRPAIFQGSERAGAAVWYSKVHHPRMKRRKREYPMSKKRLFAAVLSLLACVPSHAKVLLELTTVAAQDQTEDGKTVSHELELFRAAEVSLRGALTIADRLHAGSRVVDISFDGASGSPVYRVKTLQGNHIWEDTIDARTGQVAGNTVVSSLGNLDRGDRSNLIALKAIRQELVDAVLVAEKNTAGKAISGGLMNEDGKLNFVIVVLSGTDLKQVILEPPSTNGRGSRPRLSR
jgi:Peptidase propeptide and YPEB domain